jgi:hypothetical protein
MLRDANHSQWAARRDHVLQREVWHLDRLGSAPASVLASSDPGGHEFRARPPARGSFRSRNAAAASGARIRPQLFNNCIAPDAVRLVHALRQFAVRNAARARAAAGRPADSKGSKRPWTDTR